MNSTSKEPTNRTSSKALAKNRIKNSSGAPRKILNKSTSQKLSLSGLVSPKNNTTTLKKIFDFKSPSLKMLTTRKSKESDSRVQKIGQAFESFKSKHNLIAKEKTKKKHFINFVEKLIEGKVRNVNFI